MFTSVHFLSKHLALIFPSVASMMMDATWLNSFAIIMARISHAPQHQHYCTKLDLVWIVPISRDMLDDGAEHI
jgi:hypothetical protein